MSDLPERLRNMALCLPEQRSIFNEAADEIDRLHVVQAMEKYWQRQYTLARAHLDKIRDALSAPPSDAEAK